MQQITDNTASDRLQEEQLAEAYTVFNMQLVSLPFTLGEGTDIDYSNITPDTMTTQGNNIPWLEAIKLASYLTTPEGENIAQALKTSRNTRRKRASRKGDREATIARRQNRSIKSNRRPKLSLPSLRLI